MGKIPLLSIALLLLPSRTMAQADGPDYWSVRGAASGDVLLLRAEPDPHAGKLAEIPPDATCLKNLGCRGGLTLEEFTGISDEQKVIERERSRWCRVEFQGRNGWVPGAALREAAEDCFEPKRSDQESGVEPVQVEGYLVDSAAERPGGDYAEAFARDFQECARRCSGEERCKAFDYHMDLHVCRLKEGVPAPRRNPKVISGVKE